MIDKLVRTLIRNRVLVIILILAIIVAGYVCYYNIPKKENPSVTFPGYFVTTIYPGASPDEVDQFVTSKVEDAILDEFDNLQYVQSTSINSASVVIVLYDFDVQKSEVESPLRTAVDSVQSSLPSMCYESTVTAIMVENTQFIIALSGEHYSSDDLVSYAQTIQKKLENVQGVTSVEIVGERTKQVNVKCDPDKLLLYGINIENILNLLLAQNVSIPSGTIDYESGTITVNTPSVFESLKDIENVVVSASEESLAFVRLKDVASVSIDYADSYYYRQDGIETVLLVGCFEDGLNAVNIGKKVREEIEQIKLELPSDLSFHEVMYSPEDVDNNIKGFMLNMLESVILIMIVVMIGVKLRNGIVISVSIPLSIFATFIVMYVLDIEFQFISIAALIISLGILVDNSIVISEAVQQHLNRGEEREDAIVAAVREVYRSVLTSTLTTFATFGVLYFIPGTIGLVVSTIPTVVISALTASYLISMLLVPVLAYMFFQPESEIRIQKESIVEKSIIKILDTALKHKGITIAVAFSTLIIAVLLVTSLGIKFFPGSTKPVIYINVVSESTSLSKTDRRSPE